MNDGRASIERPSRSSHLDRARAPSSTGRAPGHDVRGAELLSRPDGGVSAPPPAAGTADATTAGPPSRAITNDALESLEPLLRFLNLDRSPTSLDDLAKAVDGYRIICVIASVSAPRESRLGYDCDMAIEAVQRSIESEGYTLDRFRFPWLDPGLPCPARTTFFCSRATVPPRPRPLARTWIAPIASPRRSSTGGPAGAVEGQARRATRSLASESGRRPPGESGRGAS